MELLSKAFAAGHAIRRLDRGLDAIPTLAALFPRSDPETTGTGQAPGAAVERLEPMEPRSPRACERGHKTPEIAHYRVQSEILDQLACNSCAAEAKLLGLTVTPLSLGRAPFVRPRRNP